MKRFALIASAFVPAVILLLLSLRPYTHPDLAFLALPIGLPVIFLLGLVFYFAVETKRPILKTTWPLLLSSAIIVSIWMTDWPLHLAFKRAKPELDRLAGQLENGEEPALPRRAGHFLIREGGVRSGTPFLTVIANPAGPTRFVRAATSDKFNVWSEMQLSPEWILVKED